MCARRSSQQARSGASSLRFRRRLIEATRGSGAGRRGPPRGMGGRAFERRARIAWRRADFGAARSAPAGLAAAPGPPLWTVCPSGLRGWTQVPLAQAAWVQIPQLSCRRGSPRPLPPAVESAPSAFEDNDGPRRRARWAAGRGAGAGAPPCARFGGELASRLGVEGERPAVRRRHQRRSCPNPRRDRAPWSAARRALSSACR